MDSTSNSNAILITTTLTTAAVLLKNRVPIYASIIPERSLEPMIIPGQQVRNFYNMNLRNMTYEDRELKMEIVDSEKLHPVIHTGKEGATVNVPANGSAQLRIFIETKNLPKAEKPSSTFQIMMNIEDVNNPSYKITKTLPLRLPNDPTIQ